MANKLTGAEVRIEQFVSMSRYACMDLVTADVSTPEVLRFVKVCQKPSHDQLFDFLVKAVDSQKDSVRKARSRLPLETIISLYSCQLKGSRKLYSSLNTLALIWVLRALGLFKPRMREVIVSHPDIYSEVPLVGRPGVRLPYVKYFGLHYQILEDSAVITIMPSVNWTIPNPEVVSELRSSLDQIYDIVAACKG